MKNNRKGFTLVELIIVIVVIAILTAILIPTIFSLTKKAKISNDVVTAHNLNAAISLSLVDINDYDGLKKAIGDIFGVAFLETLSPESSTYGYHFWFDNETKQVILSTVEDLEDKGEEAIIYNCPNSNIVYGYTLLDATGSDIASLLSGISNICSKSELRALVDSAIKMYENGDTYLENLIDYLSYTTIINSQGSFRFDDLSNVVNLYFPSDYVSLGTQILYTYNIGTNTTDIHKVSLGYPIIGDGVYGQYIEIKDTMYFGTQTLVVEEDCDITIYCDLSSVEDFKNVFAAEATNAYIALANDLGTKYVLVDDKILDAVTGETVFEGLEYSDGTDFNYKFPYTEKVSQTALVEKNNLTNKTTSESYISIENTNVSAVIPEGVKVEDSQLTLSVTPMEISESNVVLTGYATKSIDVHIEGVSKFNNVPIIINIGSVLPKGLNSSAVKLYHIENDEPVLMQRVSHVDDNSSHNTYSYNPNTGEVTVALKSFSEIMAKVDQSNKWAGNIADGFDEGSGTENDPYMIATVEQLAYLAQRVNDDGKTYAGIYFKLKNDLVINDWDLTEDDIVGMTSSKAKAYCAKDFSSSATNDPAFEQKDKAYKTWVPIGNGSKKFSGIFDGNGYSISGLYKLYYVDPMDKTPMGLFGWVHDATIKNLTIEDSFIYTYGGTVGLVTGYASGNTTIENVTVKDNFVTSYNYPLGGIVGYMYGMKDGDHLELNNVKIDSSNLLESLWGTYDSQVGGLVGRASANTKITIRNCQVWPELSLYNDCCANYQWFAYRYSGMLVGYVTASDREDYLTNSITCEDVLIKYGEWTDQYYCELKSLGKGSYNGKHEWKYTRIDKEQVARDENGVVIGCKVSGEHGTGHTSHSLYPEDEDHCAVNITFNQLFGGGQGVYGETPDQFKDLNKNATITVERYTNEPIETPDFSNSFELKFKNTDSYLYRVGNLNTIQLDKLFGAVVGTNIGSTQIDVEFENRQGTGAIYTPNTTNWGDGTIKFSGSGVIRVILKYFNQVVKTLNLEVIDAQNATSAMNAISNNVCLICDITTSSNLINISNGYAFYGNGFRITNRYNGKAKNHDGMTLGYIQITKGSTLDNVILDCGIYPRAYLYTGSGTEYVKQSNNLIETVNNNNYYGYQHSAVTISGDSTISNCYIKGARNNILVGSGNINIINTVCDRGALTNIHIRSSDAYTITLENLTTIQYISKDDYNVGNDVEGVGILIGDEEISSNPKVIINGSLNQYNWICSNDSNTIDSSSIASTIIDKAISQNSYQHDYNNTKYVNMGILYFNTAKASIVDNRDGHGYELKTISIMANVSGQVYSILSGYGSVELKDSNYTYLPNSNGVYIPLHNIINLPTTLPNDETYCWNDSGTIRIQFPLGDYYNFNIEDHIQINRYSGDSENYYYSCEGAVVNNNIITFTNSGSYIINIDVSNASIYNINGILNDYISYSVKIPVDILTPDNSWKDAEITIGADNPTGVIINSGGDRYYWIDIFDGLTILDYDKDGNETIVLDGSNTTSKKNFVSKIVSVSPTGDLCSGDYSRSFTLTFTLNDGRVLKMDIGRDNSTTPSNSPGGTKALYLRTNSSNDSLYIVTNSAASSSGVTSNMNSKKFTYVYKIYNYKFTGFSGAQVTNNNSHYMATGLFNGTYTTPKTGTRPTTTFSPSINYTITFDVNGGICSQTYGYTTSSNTKITLPTPSRAHFAFDGWYTSAVGGTKIGVGNAEYIPKSNITLYAHWKAPFRITFDVNGGNIISPSFVENYSGESITLPNITRDSFWLKGWYVGDTKVGTGGGSYTIPEEDITLVAHWSPIYTITYDITNGGTVSPTSNTYEGSAISLPTPTPGSQPTFEGWYTAASGGTRIGGAGDSYTPTADITLYAQWSTNIPVTFDANGGSCSTTSATYDGATPIILPTATRAGYQFNGWYTAASGETKIGNVGASYIPTSSVTIYAQWTGYVVTYNANSGSVSPSSASGVVTLPTPTRTGYTFNGWYTATSGGTKIGNGGASYTPTADITIYAQWSQQTFTVTIKADSNGSVSPTSISNVPYGATVTVSSNTIKINGTKVTATADSDYSFDKWDITNGATITSDKTITASFKFSGFCLLPDTLITLADGTQKMVKDLNPGDQLLVFNHLTGLFESGTFLYDFHDDNHDNTLKEVLRIAFDNGNELEIIAQHRLFDATINQYIDISIDNIDQYINDEFISIDPISHEITKTKISNYEIHEDIVGSYSPVVPYYMNYIAGGMLNGVGNFKALVNYFDYNDDLSYNEEAMQQDIETYGLYDYEVFAEYVPYEIYEAFNGQYLKIAVEKGLCTFDEIIEQIKEYVDFYLKIISK